MELKRGNGELPGEDEMYEAFARKDASYEGLFFAAVLTTGIFCRPSCPAKKAKRENVEFYRDQGQALRAGFRPCKLCRPLEEAGRAPPEVEKLIEELQADPGARVGDAELRLRGLSPESVRRWFKARYGLTFQGYQRLIRVNRAIGLVRAGSPVLDAGFEAGFGSASSFGEAVKRATGMGPREASAAPVLTARRFSTPLGPMMALASATGLVLLEFTDRRMLERGIGIVKARTRSIVLPGDNEILERTEREIAEYFLGKRKNFTVPLEPAGSDFQLSVWEVLRAIPYGETRSYADQARALGDPAKVRAVANANGDNKIAVIVPCHRVIGSDGNLMGYGGGLWRKKWLLEHEAKGR